MENTEPTTPIRATLKSQYYAALEMLRETIERCPDDLWFAGGQVNPYWQLAYHTLFYTHLYIQTDEHAFVPWEHHQVDVHFLPGQPDPENPDAATPAPTPYTREQILEYWSICDGMVGDAVDAIDILSSDSGFSWYPVSKLEHQIINIRHLQHGAAQLADRLRAAAGIGINWAGARPRL